MDSTHIILIVMDKNASFILKLVLVSICANNWIISQLTGASNTGRSLKTIRCNETSLLLGMQLCGEYFKDQMKPIDQKNWCNLSYFIWEYHHFSTCTENFTVSEGCFWPNPLVQSYIIDIHKHYFSNCSLDQVIWEDPPDDTLAILILIPVILTILMIALVVWCSKRNDIFL
ncbi:receptor activity-modifying protein 3-like isoform X2 [Erpetoichthys calabaricus]|uniref:receptor activity-modifying protein 3-like isoform X2 n=1 Tax=Erpetoichthys calabaricus TaxID=27687 RepID=UPI00109F2795|nr:receptor activity-modifying protein 3-like isoform X2 [Erpetoichthys calabaricus]